MAKGCLFGWVISTAFLIGWIGIFVMFIGFGPRNALVGFAFGLGSVALMYGLGTRFPVLLTVAGVRSPESRIATGLVQEAIRSTDNPRATGINLVRVLCWGLIVVFGGLALLFATFATALTMRHELTSGVTGAGLASGFCTALVYVIWTILQKVGVK